MANDGNDSDALLQHLINPRFNPPPDNSDVTVPMQITPSEFKNRLIFGPFHRDSSIPVDALFQNPSPSSAVSFSDISTIKPKLTHHGISRSKSAPSVAAIDELHHPVDDAFHRPNSTSKSTVRQAVALFIVYLAVMSVATVVYGDKALKTLPGWLLAAIWLLVSTLAVSLAFFYLAEAIRDKRNRELGNWVLGQNMSVSQFFSADIDHNGHVSKSEYVIFKLNQMGKITYKDIKLISDQFDKMDRANSGKITLSDILETSTNNLSTVTSV
ncbi:hypothetical protein N665_0004s0055 [Sinapis alba]|nr:hypothetical protein N665_0004s0055 [Sinapis alba]